MHNVITGIAAKYLRVAGLPSNDNLPCYCPFHKGGEETRPSFYLYVGPQTATREPGMAFCHTCGKGWSFKSLLFALGARRDLIDSITESLPTPKRRTIEQRVRGLDLSNPLLPEALLGVYAWCHRSLLRKGFDKPLLNSYDIGYDQALRRITFPLRDHLGNLVGISGRAVEITTVPKYYFYTEDELGEYVPGYKLHKGRLLWGLHRFYTTGLYRRLPYVIIVEGFKQALWIAQAGFEYVASLMGSRMTDQQATLLLRLGAPVLLMLDNDGPGREGSKKVQAKLRKQSPDVFPIRYPDGTDGKSPDDFSQEELKGIITGGLDERRSYG